MSDNQKLIALLIDGDNATSTLIPQIFKVISAYGKPIIKKIYGDWSQETLKRWEPVAREHEIDLAPHFNVSSGKNATDIALVIDAMDMLWQHGHRLDGFCIVSSDSDFTHLAKRIKKNGLFVLGIGTKNSQSLAAAYDHFIAIEDLNSQNPKASVKEVSPPREEFSDKDLLILALEAYNEAMQKGVNENDGWVQLIQIKQIMGELSPNFMEGAYYKSNRVLAEKLKALAESEPNTLEVYEQLDNKPVIHYLRAIEEREIDKFRKAYKYAADVLKYKDNDGWVKLALIGKHCENSIQIMNLVFTKIRDTGN